jgi:NNP family nitrate/nitrite transporter-like MFS transporter
MPKALGIWFPRNELAFVNGISTAGLGLGGAVGMATSASILSPAFGGWRETMLVIAGCLSSTGILWMLLYKDRRAEGPTGEKSQSVLKNFKKVFKVKDIWLLSIFYGLHMVGMMGVITFLPISLQERGVERAGELASIMMGMAVIFNILGGILSDKLGIRKSLLILCTIISGLCVFTFSVLSGIPIIIALVIAGAGIGTLVPILFTLPIEIKEIGPGLAATAVGLLLMVGNTGGFFGPLISGKLMDITGSYIASFIFMGAVLIVAAVFIIPIKDTVREKKQSEVALH